jgi:hypothetical protein
MVFSPLKDIIPESKTRQVDDLTSTISPLALMAFLNIMM